MLLKIGFKSSIFWPMWPWNLMDDLEKNPRIPLLYYIKLCASFQSHLWILTGVTVLEIWWMTLNNRTPSLLCQALCIISKPSLNSNWSYSPETLNLGWNFFFSSRVTIKFDGRPWKTIGHLFYTTPSLEHYFKAIGDFKLELQSRNIQFGSKSISLAVWPWNLINGTSSFVHHFVHHMWIQTGVTVWKLCDGQTDGQKCS